MSAYDDSTHATNPSITVHDIKINEHRRTIHPFTVDIDFDEASAAWMANKVRRGPSLCYQCTAMKKDGNPCVKPILSHTSISPMLCKMHQRFSMSHLSHPSNTSAKGKSLNSKDSACIRRSINESPGA